MELSKIKEYLSYYLTSVVVPKINNELVGEDDEPISMSVTDIKKGSYQPPIYHVFINVEPHDMLKSSLRKTESDITDFFKIFSINNRIKTHWNKRPGPDF